MVATIFATTFLSFFGLRHGTLGMAKFALFFRVCTCCACYVAHTQKIGRSWLLFLHGPNIIITWVMQFIIFKRVVCIIITNKHHNRHVCNSNEGTKVSFMLKEIIYGKSPIFWLFSFWPKYKFWFAYCHMTAIHILAQ